MDKKQRVLKRVHIGYSLVFAFLSIFLFNQITLIKEYNAQISEKKQELNDIKTELIRKSEILREGFNEDLLVLTNNSFNFSGKYNTLTTNFVILPKNQNSQWVFLTTLHEFCHYYWYNQLFPLQRYDYTIIFESNESFVSEYAKTMETNIIL